jgi:hypothetical protein
MHIPFGLELVLVLAALVVVVFVTVALPLLFQMWRSHKRFLERSINGPFPKESHHV